MKKLTNKKVSTLVIILGSMTLFTVCYKTQQIANFPLNKAIQPNLIDDLTVSTLADKESLSAYLKSFDEQENTLWHEITNAITITKDEFIAIKNEQEWRSDYNESVQQMLGKKQSKQLISQKNIHLINEVLTSCGIDPKKITIKSSNAFSPAAATDSTLSINEEKFNALSPKMQKYILAHESSHIINQDHSTRCLIDELNDEQKNNNQLKKLIPQLNKFFEIKADIFAMLQGEEFAEGHIEFMELCIRLYGNKPGKNHPSNGERLEIGQHLLTMMQNKSSNQV